MINKKWLTEIGYEVGYQGIQPQLPILPQISSGNQAVLGPNPASFTATVPGGITGQPTTITIQARDSNGQSVVVGGNAVFVSVTGSNSASGVATDNNNGTYTFTYIPTVAGADQVAITADGIAITGSPYTSTVSAATQITKQQILTYLQSLPAKTSNKLLVASQVSTWNHNTPPWLDTDPKPAGYGQVLDPVNQLFAQTGKYPAVLGQEYDNSPGNPNYNTTPQTTYAIQWAQTGGLNMGLYEWNNPWTGGNPFDTTITTTFADVITPGTAAFTAFMAQTATLGDQLATLQAAGVVVLMVPISEMNGNWFWWGAGITNGATAAQYQTLFKQIVNYIQVTRGLTNVIWAYVPYGGTGPNPHGNYTAFYPGASFVDVVGFDYFGDNAPSTGLTTWNYVAGAAPAYTALLAFNKPIICAQTGPYVNMVAFSEPNTFDYTTLINNIRSSTPNVCLFLAWDGQDRLDVQNNSVGVMTDPWTIDRSEVAIAVTTPALVITQQPSTSPIAGQPFGTNPIVQLTDGAGHNIASGGIQITIAPSSSAIALAVTPNPLLTNSVGTATPTSIIPTGTVGTYTMTFSATGYQSVTSVPFVVSSGSINPAHCVSAVPGSPQNQPTVITVQSRDTWDNNLSTGGATVVVQVTGANTVTPAVVDNGNGTYSATYVSANIGTNVVTITVNGVAIAGSPFTQIISSAAFFPNQPAGMTRIVETPMAVQPTSADFNKWVSTDMIAGQRFMFSGTPGATFLEQSASQSSMISPPSYLQEVYPTGFVDGVAPGAISFWQSSATNGFTELYWALTLMCSTTASNGLFQTHSVNQKLIYVPYADTVQSNQSFLVIIPNGFTSQYQLQWRVRQMTDTGVDPGGTALLFAPNTGSNPFIQVGQFARIEVYMKLNTHTSDPAPHDGILKMWVNGVQTFYYGPGGFAGNVESIGNVPAGYGPRYVSAANPLGFYRVKWDAVFGGNTGEVIQNTQFINFDHLYVSAR